MNPQPIEPRPYAIFKDEDALGIVFDIHPDHNIKKSDILNRFNETIPIKGNRIFSPTRTKEEVQTYFTSRWIEIIPKEAMVIATLKLLMREDIDMGMPIVYSLFDDDVRDSLAEMHLRLDNKKSYRNPRTHAIATSVKMHTSMNLLKMLACGLDARCFDNLVNKFGLSQQDILDCF